MPLDVISYLLAKKKLDEGDYKLSTLPIDTDLDMENFKITDLGEPVDPYDAPTRRYVDIATTGLGINYYLLDAADADVPAYKQLTLTPPELAEAYVEITKNSAGDYEIGSWIASAGSIPTLRLGVFTTNFQAKKVSGILDVRFFFRLYERDSGGSETLIEESSLSDIVSDRRDVVTSLIMPSDHVMATGSRLVLKIYVRYLSSGPNTTVRLYYQGDVRSRLATPIAKEILDTNYAAKLRVVTVSSNYNASANRIVLADASGGAITITLPSPQADAIVNVKKIDSSENAVTIDGAGANIDGNASIQITTQYESYTLVSDGSNWWII
ncbi:hypothetical protein DRN97_04360 [Methanosarcinales archaeon]|nr:MAG: hypothetical protein DRN97_04360 [Methanosarcinales archaeon]